MSADLRDDHIAIIGLAGRFPGARDVREYWRNLTEGVESITFLSDEELRERGLPDWQLGEDAYVKAAPMIEDMEGFDARFFGFTPLEAQIRDPQGRLFLETCHSALEDAGCVLSRYDGAVGVYGGGANDFYGENYVKRNRAVRRAAGGMSIAVSNHPDYLATAVAYRLGLQGPAVNVQTACSTSLVAVHLACQALRLGECDMALAGGVEVELPYGEGYWWLEGGIMSRDGHCRAFDAKASGTIFSTGVGVVTLKRLADARADGDHIYAVIRGSAVNNDGSARAGFTAPGIEGQTKLVLEALAAAEIHPESVTYVEAHGTGTLVGDPIEVTALSRAFRLAGAEGEQYCGIGSVKPNVGHLGPAAGVAGLIKVCLALEHEQLPPSINVNEVNPAIELEDSPFFINTSLREWPRWANPRRAGVSSFGIGGTNAHLIVEEPPAPEPEPAEPADRWQLIPVSAKTPAAAEQAARRLAVHLRDNPGLPLPAVARTMQTGRAEHPHRRAVVARESGEAAALLGMAKGPQVVVSSSAAVPRTVALMFPGQGAQHPSMGRDLYERQQTFRDAVNHCAEHLRGRLGLDLRGLFYPEPGQEEDAARQLAETRLTQPALFTVEYAMARLLESWGIWPAAMIGHSVGEYVAAHVAGVFSLECALDLVATRGQLMQSMPRGAMLAVPMQESLLAAMVYGEVEIAAANATHVTVVAGPEEAIADFDETLRRQGIEGRRLHTSHAFHSALMESALAPFQEAVAKTAPKPPTIPFVSNVTGTWITDEQAMDPAYWAQHLRQPVRFADGLVAVGADQAVVLVEAGPGESLTTLAKQCLTGQGTPIVPTMRHPLRETDDEMTFLAAAGRLWATGVDLDWAAGRGRRRKTPLPEYPYERQRFWVDPDPETQAAEANADEPDLLPVERAVFRTTWRESPLPLDVPAAALGARWLIFSPARGPVEALGRRLAADGAEVTMVIPGTDFAEIDAMRVALLPGSRGDYQRLFDRFAAGSTPTHIVHGWTAVEPVRDVLDEAHVSAVADTGFYSLMFLAQEVDRRSPEHPIAITVVSAGVQEIAGDEPIEPAKALLLGPVQLINREISGVTCRSVDIQVPCTLSDEAVAGQLLGEIHTPGDDVQIGWRGRKRWTWSYDRLPMPGPGGVPALLKPDGTYLITGGLGGIGLTVALDLARAVRARLVLASRSGFPERECWDALLADETADEHLRSRLRRLLEIEAAGGEIMVASCDIGDEAQLRALAAAAEERFGGIDGVFHSAGVTAGGMLAVRTREEAEEVLRPKVAGTLSLHRVLGDSGAFLVLFSSIAAVVGTFGLVDYCAANCFLDAFARRLSTRGAPVLSIGWGMWNEVGMASEAEESAPHLFRELQSGIRYEDVDAPLLDRRVRDRTSDAIFSALLQPDGHWALTEHRIGGAAVLPGTYCLELIHEAAGLAAGPTGAEVEISDVIFLGPAVVAGPRELRVVLREEGDEYDATIITAPVVRGHANWTEHVKARVRVREATPAPGHDLEAIKAACAELQYDDSKLDSSAIVRFGAHWNNVGLVRVGEGEEIARLELRPEFHSECDRFALHPSLFDDAVSNSQHLPILRSRGDQYLPFSYQRIIVRRPLPPRFFSHVRHLDAGDGEIVSSDITLIDDEGRELVRVEGYSLRRIDHEAIIASVRGDETRPTVSVDPEDRGAVSDWGITPEYGADVLRRLLDTSLAGHVVVCPEGLARNLRRTADLNSDVIEQELANAQLTAAGTMERFLDTPYVEPATGVEAVLASLWAQSLGVSEVGAEDDFFELGGNSLVAVQLGARMRERFDVDLPVGSLFERPTVRRLAATIEESLLEKVKAMSEREAAEVLALLNR
ncbi:SDR family NAD(P)-dependent oxidoreductase [Sphaerisporangium viridialbum]|uniref:type I polyketide synthase n=1 Tax=Sphaerisporangium viridialbum TaxID=46189 RepID=UPI003C753110